MKLVKKIASLLLAMVMVFTMSTVAFAEQEGELSGGTITINDAVSGQTYSIYQILYLESYDSGAGAYSYKANSAWEDWLTSEEGSKYVEIDAQGYVTWKGDAEAAEFAKKALEYAQTLVGEGDSQTAQIAPDDTKKAEGALVTFSDLKLGYYLVDTTLGSLCSLDTTNPGAEINEKNEQPTIEKEVQEDSDKNWGDKNTAQIGDTVNFQTTITVQPGAQNYVLHDQMTDGLTLNTGSITVKVGDSNLENTNYTVVITGLEDGCDFHIVFDQDYLDSITEETTLVVTYSAVLNENAVISEESNINKTKLDYGDDSKTEWDETKTYTFEFDIVKTDAKDVVLDGAEFELYDAETGGNKISLVEEEKGQYRVATSKETEVGGFESAVISTVNGKATVEGLDANTTYWLEEIKAPVGYNKLDGRVAVEIKEANLSTTIDNDIWKDGGVHIINQTGAELPTTGGMGTTILYVIGGVLVIGAGVMLVIRKRLSSAK